MKKERFVKLAITLAVASATTAFATEYDTTITGKESGYEDIRTEDASGVVKYQFTQEDKVVISDPEGVSISSLNPSPDSININHLNMSVTNSSSVVQGISFFNQDGASKKSLVLGDANLRVKNSNQTGTADAHAVEMQGQGSTLRFDSLKATVSTATNGTDTTVYGISTNFNTTSDNHITGGDIELVLSAESSTWVAAHGISLAGSGTADVDVGNVAIDVTSNVTGEGNGGETWTVGIQADDNKTVTAESIHITTQATAAEGNAAYSRGIESYGLGNTIHVGDGEIRAIANGDSNNYLEAKGVFVRDCDSEVKLGNVDITTQANVIAASADALDDRYVDSIGIDNRGGSVAMAGGSIDVSVTGELDEGNAYGAFVLGGGDITIGSAEGGVVDISAKTSATYGMAIGLAARDGEINYFGGTIQAGDHAIWSADAGKVSLFGTTIVENSGSYGIYTEEGGLVELNEGAVVYANSMYNDGEVIVNKATLITGELEKNQKYGTWSVSGGLIEFGQAMKDGEVRLGNVVANDSSTLKFESGTTYSIESFEGSGTTLEVASLQENTVQLLNDSSSDLTVTAPATLGNNYASEAEFANAIASVVTNGTAGQLTGDFVKGDEGDILGAFTGTIDGNKVVLGSITPNSKISALGSVNTLNVFQWRHDMNDLTKRMGELRLSPEGVGSWARVYGSQQTYKGIESKNQSIQVGADYDVGANWKVGAALTYTNGDTSYDDGEADHDAFGLVAYGTWMNESGLFVDVIAKYSRMSTDFSVKNMSGSYDNNAFSASVEAGWNIRFSDVAFVEPQVELTYGQVVGDEFKTGNGVTIAQDDFDSLIGRVGLRGGFLFPDNRGSLYARASVAHDFEGEMSSAATKGASRAKISDDLSGTWYEFGIGANFNLTDRAYVWADLEKSNGGEVKEDYRWTVGARYVW